MTSREKAIYLLNEILAIEKYAEGFSLDDYADKKHAAHIQQAAQKIMEFMFKEKYGNATDAASNALQLILIKQVSGLNMPPEQLKMFINIFLPKRRAELEATIVKMFEIGDQEVEDPDENKPVNPLAN